jgi:uncharacterized protein YjbI with pentapeptide repeats
MSTPVESTLISAAVTIVAVLAIAAVAGAGFRIARSINQRLARRGGGHVTGGLRTSRLRMAGDAAQRRLLRFGAGLFAAGVDTARNFGRSRRATSASEQGELEDRYVKAAGELDSGRLDVRTGGIYALERVAHDWPLAHPAVMEVLAGFVRKHSHAQRPSLAEDGPGAQGPGRMPHPDVQAALTVIGRRGSSQDRGLVNLDRADLTGANLTRANLAYASLAYASLAHANLSGADLTGADLTGADLTDADLTGADLTGAIIRGADLTRANLTRAGLTAEGLFGGQADEESPGANLTYANLTGAIIRGADLTHAILDGADLTGADLAGADLTSANLSRANLTDAHLTDEDLTGGGRFGAGLPSANLTHANLFRAKLTHVKLSHVKLTGAGLFDADLTRANLTDAQLAGADLLGARWPPDAVVPLGWWREADLGRLQRGDTDPGGAAPRSSR